MINYLNYVAPDYSDEYLEMSPNFSLNTPGSYRQVRNETDGGEAKVVTMKNTPDMTVPVKFTGKEKADRDILLDLYFNPSKAYGMARTYVWKHPQTEDLYTVQNISPYSEDHQTYNRYDISFTFKIIGKATEDPPVDAGIIFQDTDDIIFEDTPDITFEDVLG